MRARIEGAAARRAAEPLKK